MPAIDANLILDSGRTVTVDETESAISVEGGFFAIAHLLTGAMSGASTTLDAYIQVSDDEGSNYYMAAKFQQLGPSDDSKYLKCVCYIRRPDTAGELTRVRVRYEVAGSAPSYVITRCWLEPMLTLGVPAQDEAQTEGLCAEVSAI